MTSSQPTSDRVLRLINGYWATGIIGAAATHSLFTHLAAGADTVEELAARAGISERGAQTLLDGLVSLELVEVQDGRYANTAESAMFLDDEQPTSLASFAKFKLSSMGQLVELPDIVRAGGPLADVTVEVADNPHWITVVRAIAPQSLPVARMAAEALGIADAGEISILDIGGGSGIYSAVWLELNPDARSTQIDWKPINAVARELMAERGLADRFSCIDGDFHTVDFGTAAHDIAVYSHIAHQEGPEDNIALLAKIRSALKPGGTLVICDYVVEDDRSGPPFPLVFASEMLAKSKHGTTWRRADYEAWLAKAGFDSVTFQSTPSPSTLVFAR
jgi:SAM-dependent methyltransferase